MELAQVQAAAEELGGPVTMYLYLGGSDDAFGNKLSNVAYQMSGVSMNRLSTVPGDGERFPDKPSLTLSGPASRNIHYYALPEGPEFGPFIDAVRWLGGASELSPGDAHGHLASLKQPVDLIVLIAEGCPHCPRMVRTAVSLAVMQPLITVSVVDALRFSDIAEHFKVKSTPTTIIDGGLTIVGALDAAGLSEKIVTSMSDESLTRVLDSMISSGRAEDAGALVCQLNQPHALLPLFTSREFSRRMGTLVAMDAALEEQARSLDAIVPDLCLLLSDEEAGLRGDTAELLGKIGDPAAIPALQAVADDPDPDVKEAVLEALEALNEGDD
jgi:hypothetical protein